MAYIPGPVTVVSAGPVMSFTVQPASPQWTSEFGIEWLGLTEPTASPSAPVTTGFGVSIGVSGNISYITASLSMPVASVLFGFVVSTNPSNTQPSTWYPGTIALVGSQTVVSLVLGPTGFQPTLGTTYWVWIACNGSAGVQSGQLLSVT